MPCLSLRLLGPFKARYDNRPLSGFRTRATQALLIYLAVQPEQAHGREKLMTMLWPGMPEKSARANLRQTLYQLRQDVPEVKAKVGNADRTVAPAIANRQQIQLNPAADVDTDVLRFEALLARTAAHEHLDLLVCADCRRDLEEAAAFYHDHFLIDFYLEDSNEFENWAQGRREHYRRKVLDALEVLTTICARQEAYAEGQAFAERQLAIDNLRESAYRQLMELLAYSGRREGALAVFERCRRTLVEELGMEPSARTSELNARIMAGNLTVQPAVAQGVRGLELREVIGEGAYGVIHRAFQPSVGRDVAVKVIRRKYANDPEFIRRFEAEAQIVARLEHPYIVPLYDYWRDPDGAYLVMRYVHEGSLESALKAGPLPPKRVILLVDQIGSALAAAHFQGVVHRDIKPANILLDEAGNAYLTDFGIAKTLAGGAAGPAQITSAGSIIGTLDYISPEQIKNEPVSPQTDIYSFGAVLYETLTGEKPFADSTVANLLYSHLHEPIPQVSASRPDLPAALDDVLQRATAKRPADRFDNILEMAAAFRKALNGRASIVTEAAIEPRAIPAVAELYNPYKGLRAFQEADADDFFGRDDLVERLMARLTPGPAGDGRFLALVGPSGSGKSSAVKAGLIAALRTGAVPGSEKWFVAEMTPGSRPLDELAQALLPLAVDPPPSLVQPMERDLRGLLRTIRRVLPDEDGDVPQLLLVIDQFEELFTLVADAEQRIFFLDSLLAALNAPRSPLRLVITLRADFYDRPLQQLGWGQLLKENTEVILPLSQAELTWSVREPARRMGVTLEEGLAGAIVADVTDQPGGLPLLQYALTELFDLRQDRLMTWEAYEEIGGVLGALGRRAMELYAGLDEAGQALARQLFLRLVTIGESAEDTRRRVLRTELQSLAAQMDTVIDAFGQARLLTFDRDPLTREPTVEVAHEALLREWSRLRGWLDESRNDVRMQRQLAQAAAEWRKAGRDDSYLLRGSRLEQFAGWADLSTVALTRDEAAYLAAALESRRERQAKEEARRQRELETAQQLAETERARAEEQAANAGRLRRRAVFLAGALLVAAALAVAAFFFARQSNENAQAAEANAALASTRESEALLEAEQRATAEAAAIEERQAAEEQAQLARSRELAAAALLSLNDDPERSILLAMHALSQTYTTETEQALRQAIDTSRVRQTLWPPEGFPTSFVTTSPDGSRLFASGPHGGTLWDIDTGRVMYTRTVVSMFDYPQGTVTEEWINKADFSPDGTLLVLPNEQWAGNAMLTGTVTILMAESGEELLTFAAHESWVQVVTFNPGGTQFASTGGDGTIRIWDLAATLAAGTGQEVARLCCHRDWVQFNSFIWSVAYSPDGTRLVTTDESTIKVWSIATGDELFSINAKARDVVFSLDGRYVVAGTDDGTIQVFESEEGTIHAMTRGAHGSVIESIAFGPDGTRLGTAGQDRTAKIWVFADGQVAPDPLVLSGHSRAEVSGLSFIGDGHLVATGVFSSFPERTMRIWDVSANNGSEFGLNAHVGPIRAIDFSPDGSRLTTASEDGTAAVWDVATEETLFSLVGHSGRVMDIEYSPDGTMLATASTDNTAIVWDASSGEVLWILEGHGEGIIGNVFEGVLGVAFSPDGVRLATAGADQTARLWDLASGQELLVLSGHTGGLTNVVFSPDGLLLATSSDSPDGSVRIWDPAAGQELLSIPPSHGPRVWGLAFNQDGTILATSGRDATAKIWQLDLASNNSRLLATLIGHSNTVGWVIFSPADNILATGGLVAGGGEEAKLWDLSAIGQNGVLEIAVPELLSLPGGRGLALSPDGKTLVAGFNDGSFRSHMLDLSELLALARSRLTRTWTAEECRQYRIDPCPAEP